MFNRFSFLLSVAFVALLGTSVASSAHAELYKNYTRYSTYIEFQIQEGQCFWYQPRNPASTSTYYWKGVDGLLQYDYVEAPYWTTWAEDATPFITSSNAVASYTAKTVPVNTSIIGCPYDNIEPYDGKIYIKVDNDKLTDDILNDPTKFWTSSRQINTTWFAGSGTIIRYYNTSSTAKRTIMVRSTLMSTYFDVQNTVNTPTASNVNTYRMNPNSEADIKADYTGGGGAYYKDYTPANLIGGGSSTDDPLQHLVGYVNDADYSIHLMRPVVGSLPNQNINLTVNPDPDFSTVWAVRFPPDLIDDTFITVRQCLDDSFDIEDCTIIHALESVADLGASGDSSVVSFELEFPVIDAETEYYLIQEWKTVDDVDVEVVATAPLILTGDVGDSFPYDMDYYDYDNVPDYGFFGNLLRDLFLPNSNYFVNKINALNSIRVEKFSWYYDIKDEFSAGLSSLDSASSDPPDLTISFYDSPDILIFDTTYIDPYISTIKTWISAFLWLVLCLFLFKKTSTILKS